MGISSSGFHFKNTIINGQDGHITRNTSKIKDENIAFTANLGLNELRGYKQINICELVVKVIPFCPSYRQ